MLRYTAKWYPSRPMERAELDQLARRLVENPHDEDALGRAHQIGEADPKAYATFLERVGTDSADPAHAAYWLAQAGNVWITTLGDAHRGARTLMMSIDRDPTAPEAADRLAELYREKGDAKALVALLDRRAKALSPLAVEDGQVRDVLAGMHEELGQLWSSPPLEQPRKAIENYRKAFELDPSSAFAIFHLRELYKQTEDWENAIPLFAAELTLEQDPARRLGLFRDEATTRRLAGDLRGVTRALEEARAIDDSDPALQQEFASSVLDRVHANEPVSADERREAVDLLLELAEAFEGEHGFAYAGAALELAPGNDRGFEVYVHRARAIGNTADLSKRAAAYLGANPHGSMVDVARGVTANGHVADAFEDLSNVAESTADGNEPVASNFGGGRAPGSKSPNGLLPTFASDSLDAAQMLARQGKKAEAFAKYKEVLDSDPANEEALVGAEDYLRSQRDYAQLRNVLLASVRATAGVPQHIESRKERLREIAGLCEGNLRDIDGAVSAWRQLLSLDRTDETAASALKRLLERSQRWDDLATLLEQEATIEQDVDTKVQLEKRLAKLQEEKRKDFVAAGEAYARIARLSPHGDQAVSTASQLFEKGERLDLAADVIDELASRIDDPVVRGHQMERLGGLRERLGDTLAAGEAFAQAAETLRNAKLWEDAERLFLASDAWEQAANAAHQRGLSTGDMKQRAAHLSRTAEHLLKAEKTNDALGRLEEATNLDPLNEAYAESLASHYAASDRIVSLVQFLEKRGERLSDRAARVAVRRQAATLAATRLKDLDQARELWLKVLEDGEDNEALEQLIEDAVERADHTEATTLLHRLGQNTTDKLEKARVALREAELLADGTGDVDTALALYESILTDLDPTSRPALQAIADLQEARDGHAEAANALERELVLTTNPSERGQIGRRLARLYEKLDDTAHAITALDVVREADPEDFDALKQLCELCEQTEQWKRVADLLVERIEIEADDAEAVDLTRKLATILADKLDRGDEALGALTDLADSGHATIRRAYVELGDRLGKKGVVAEKLREWWFDARHGAERTTALRGAFERFAEVERDAEAVAIGMDLVNTKGVERPVVEQLETLAVKTGNEEALALAHEVLAREVQGEARGHELVRQAEVQARAGWSHTEAMAHGEQGLLLVGPSETSALLERLSAIAETPDEIVDLYERQVIRSKAPSDRVQALANAAQVAVAQGKPERARTFFELALTSIPSEETLALLETSAREGDQRASGDLLRRALCEGLATGGHGARDGGRTHAALLRRAANIAYRELGDLDRALTWLGDALVAHVEAETLDVVEALGAEAGDPSKAEAVLTRALGEVFDGPFVRQLLTRRAKLRRTQLGNPAAAAVDLKKLHDLTPNDQAILDELAGLLMELGDYKTLAQLYEGQILRGKDMNARADLARRVARIWEEQLADPREAADAWRRVLRLRQGDPEATAGLERAKAGADALKKPDPSSSYAPPPLVSEQPVLRPERPAGRTSDLPTNDRNSFMTETESTDAGTTDAGATGPVTLAHEEVRRVEATTAEREALPDVATTYDADFKTADGGPNAPSAVAALLDDETGGTLDGEREAADEPDEIGEEALEEEALAEEDEGSSTLDGQSSIDAHRGDLLGTTSETGSVAHFASNEQELGAHLDEDPPHQRFDDETSVGTYAKADEGALKTPVPIGDERDEPPASFSSRPPRSIPPPLPGGFGSRPKSAPPALPTHDVVTTLAAIPTDSSNANASSLHEIASGDLLDAEELTGSDLSVEPYAMTTSHAEGREPEEVVIADDLAEIVGDDEVNEDDEEI